MEQGAYKFFIGWLVILGLFYGSTKLEGTRTLTYYILWLNIVLLIVVHSDVVKGLIEGAVPQQSSGNEGSSGQQAQDQVNFSTQYVQFAAR